MQAGPSAANVAAHSAPWSAERAADVAPISPHSELPWVSERGDTERGEATRVGDAFTGLEGRDGGRLASTDAAMVLSPPVSPPHRRGHGGARAGWGRGGVPEELGVTRQLELAGEVAAAHEPYPAGGLSPTHRPAAVVGLLVGCGVRRRAVARVGGRLVPLATALALTGSDDSTAA